MPPTKKLIGQYPDIPMFYNWLCVACSKIGNRQEARVVAETIANSPLVKTAIFGEDANWGRIAAAAGRAGVPFEPGQLDIFFDDDHRLICRRCRFT